MPTRAASSKALLVSTNLWRPVLGAVFLCLASPVLGAEHGLEGRFKEHVTAVNGRLAAEYDHLEALYKHLHANPELSDHEVKSAARMAKELRAGGFAVTEQVGGHGVVGVFKNG